MKTRHLLPVAALAALAACSGAPPPQRQGQGWTLLDTCAPYLQRTACPEAREADLQKCMAPLIVRFDAAPSAEAQRAMLVEAGCPTHVAGEKR
jgi:hypothetical protein